jgi:iron complex outermembrane receptor protein
MTRLHVNRLMIGTCVAAMTASPVFAAKTAQPVQSIPERTTSTQAPPSSNANQDIIVTAQKRAQLLIDVPQSISVITGGTLEKQQANSFQDYLKLVPGLQLDQSTPGEGRLILRGINTGGVASTVGVYMDETPFGSSSGLANGGNLAGDFDTFDLDRVEVLRGPQGTLYGASSLSGVLKFVTKLPSTSGIVIRGRAGIENVKGGDTGYQSNLVVNVPLGSNLAFRASGSYRKDGGFINSIGKGGSDVANAINGDKSYGGRASLLFKPNSNVSVRLTALAQDIKAHAASLVESDPVTLEPLYGQLTQSQFSPQSTTVKYRLYNATMVFGLGFADLTSSSSYSTQKQNFVADLTNSLSPLVNAIFKVPNELVEPEQVNLRKYSQEVRLSSYSARLDWLLGGFFTDEKALILQDFVAYVPGTFTPITTLPLLAHANVTSKYKEIAGFANATVHLSDMFDVDVGGRYSHNKQEAHQVSDGAFAGGFNDFGVDSSRENVFTYSLAPKFKLNKNAAIYARVAKGFRPGGPNIIPPGAPAALRSYKSDSIISYEAGLKTQSSDRRFSLDVAVFHIDWKDIQLFTRINGFGGNANGGGAKSDGAEFTATARPIVGLDLSLNGAYTHARLTTDTDPLVGGRKGDELPFTPKLSLGLNADYHWSLAQGVGGHVGGSLRHLSHQTAGYDGTFVATYGRQREIKAYDVVDAAAGIDFGKFSVDLYAKNLGNSHGLTSTTGTLVFNAFPAYPGGAIGTGVIRPRTVGLSITAAY